MSISPLAACRTTNWAGLPTVNFYRTVSRSFTKYVVDSRWVIGNPQERIGILLQYARASPDVAHIRLLNHVSVTGANLTSFGCASVSRLALDWMVSDVLSRIGNQM